MDLKIQLDIRLVAMKKPLHSVLVLLSEMAATTLKRGGVEKHKYVFAEGKMSINGFLTWLVFHHIRLKKTATS